MVFVAVVESVAVVVDQGVFGQVVDVTELGYPCLLSFSSSSSLLLLLMHSSVCVMVQHTSWSGSYEITDLNQAMIGHGALGYIYWQVEAQEVWHTTQLAMVSRQQHNKAIVSITSGITTKPISNKQ